MIAYTSNLSTQEEEIAGPELQDYLWLHSIFKSGLGYMRPYLQKKTAVVFRSYKKRLDLL